MSAGQFRHSFDETDGGAPSVYTSLLGQLNFAVCCSLPPTLPQTSMGLKRSFLLALGLFAECHLMTDPLLPRHIFA
jgi:hypothetical protein